MGYIDITGKIAISPIFDYASDFSEGLAAVTIGDRVGYIDKTGKIVIEPQFGYGSEFMNGVAMIQTIDPATRKVGYIDKNGKYIWLSPK